MAGINALISSLLTSVAKLLPEVKNSLFAPSSSLSTHSPDANAVENDLNALMRMLKRIKVTLFDAEEREVRDSSVKLWLKELKEVGHAAEYVIDEYMYEVYRAQVEARIFSELNPHEKEKSAHSIRVPDGFLDRIRDIRSRFDEIAKDREALRLHKEDGRRCNESVRFRAPSSHLILESSVFGRENDKEKVIDLLLSNIDEGIITVPIVGKGGLGKTTLAQLVYKDRRVKQNFDFYGWVCVSEDFTVERLAREMIESLTLNSCSLTNLGTLQEKLKEIVENNIVFIVLDDVWNDNIVLWKLFLASFMRASRVAFIVTTRSDRVAEIMQTTFPFRLGYLSEEESWSLFQHHAFGNTNYNLKPNLLNLGRQITEKCGGLPLAIKAISNLLRYENEECWEEILTTELWEMHGEMHAENDIFGVLQISYTHMPAYLRPCFLYCSLFPKGYEHNVVEMIELWIAQGYIECKGRSTLEETAFQYALELRERSFFDCPNTGIVWERFKIHDMIHDLARLNSENEFYFIERGKQCNPPGEVLHIYMDDCEGLLRNYDLNVTRLRTIVLDATDALIDCSEAKSLRTLKIMSYHLFCSRWQGGCSIFSLYHLEKLDLNLNYYSHDLKMIGNLINLKFLSLSKCNTEKIPESLCFLSNLRKLVIQKSKLDLLPKNIGNLICLQNLVIHACEWLRFMPDSLCKLSGLKALSLTDCSRISKLPSEIGNLTNLQHLIIKHTRINSLPHSLNKLHISGEFSVEISLSLDGICSTISSLKDFNILLKGTLAIEQLACIPSLEDAWNFDLISKSNLKKLMLSWGSRGPLYEKNEVVITIGTDSGFTKARSSEHMDFQVLENLQPHPNLKHLCIDSYKYLIFPRWMGDCLSCASLERISITFCQNITYLPFRNIGSLKWLEIYQCTVLQAISQDSLPPQLQTLGVYCCSSLLSITGLEELESLDRLVIRVCDRLRYFSFELISEERCHKSSLLGLKNLSPPKEVSIDRCSNLQLVENEVIPSVHCNIEIFSCLGLKEWCLRHHISYKDSRMCSEQFELESL